MRLICISDTHGQHELLTIPTGDVLVHAGDLTAHSTSYELSDFFSWMAAQKFPARIVIGGNHDRLFETHPELARSLVPECITYLQDTGCQVGGLHFWGSPVTPRFFDWAFNRDRGGAIAKHWNMIPEETDVLISHGPARGILDKDAYGVEAGCADLRHRIEALQLKAHICGHMHSSYGQSKLGHTVMVNAAICDEAYRPLRTPIVVDL